ncbi:hypothetical protein [Dyella sp. 2HG41-7]|uniref:hypothetical protein n=1 Tax=Dyella sp. 2HG41-7 TaxID=2883239 RepID=UPI001F272C06|nr:hypothetical protein [Dyella sp. 2HG41-7]
MKAISVTQHVSAKHTLLVRALAGVLGAIAAFAALPQKAEAGVFIGVGVSVGFPPPALPVYEQPPIPGPGYIWTPGYWAWDGGEYYWVPGAWILAPYYGALWTPGYWGWDGTVYLFHAGYWGDHVGFYGGINYGWGYTGIGYAGGYWGHGGFYYNRSVNRIDNVHVTNIYNRTVINNFNGNHVSYNGGRGGTMARATPQQMAFARQSRMGPVAAQQRQMTTASHDPAMRASVNHGNPSMAAASHVSALAGAGAPAARGSQFSPAAANAQRINANTIHAPQQTNNTALRSAGFAPHANMTNTANASHTAANFGNNYRPQGAAPAANMARPTNNTARPMNNMANTVSRPTNNIARPVNAYRPQQTAYRPAPTPQFRQQPQYQPQFHAAPQPQYQAYHAAPAPRPVSGGGGQPRGGGGQPHGGGGGSGGRDTHHG